MALLGRTYPARTQLGHFAGDPTLGTARVVSPAGIVSAQAFGTASVGKNISPTGIASAEAFGTAVLASIASNLTDTLRDENGAVVASTTVAYSLSTTWNGNEVQTGTFASNGSGVYSFTIPNLAGTVRYMRYKLNSADTHHGLRKMTSV